MILFMKLYSNPVFRIKTNAAKVYKLALHTIPHIIAYITVCLCVCVYQLCVELVLVQVQL